MDKVNGISAPEQLDKVFFQNALQNGLRESRIDVRHIEFLAGSGDGEKYKYSNQIYHVCLLYLKMEEVNPEKITVIVKVMPSTEGLDVPETDHFFKKEKWLLIEILQHFEILLDDVKFAPRCFYATDSPLQSLVLEDMDALGFQMPNLENGLDERHTKFALKKLGQYHAVSMVYAKRRPLMMKDYCDMGLLDPKTINPSTSLYKMLHKHLGFEIKLCSEWEGFEEITKKLQELHNDLESRIIACQKPRDGEIKVLNHGDCRVNNLLFKYDPRNNPVDMVFMDFQLSIYGSPGIDLNYFLFTSVEFEVLKKWKTLLEVYHASLRDTLLGLSYGYIPTYADIEREFKQKAAYGIFTLIGPLPIVIMEGSSFENLTNPNKRIEAVFNSERFIERLKYSLLELDKMGAFE